MNQDCIEQFIENLKARGYARSSITNKKRNLYYFYSYLNTQDITDIKQVTSFIVEKYHQQLLKRKSQFTGKELSASILTQYLGVVKQHFQFLEKTKQILINPAQNICFPNQDKQLPRNVPTENQIQDILQQPNTTTHEGKKEKAILETLYSTGIRCQELINLNVQHIDLSQGLLNIKKGKGGKDRIVPVGKNACHAIEEYLKIRKQNKYENALFLTKDGKRYKTLSLGRVVQRHARQTGHTNITCHKIRHACATHMTKAGASIKMIQQILGHSSLNTTQIYTKVYPIDLKQAHQKSHPRAKAKNEK